MKPLSICFTTNSSPWTKFHGGGQVFVHNLAQALAGMGHRITVVYTGPRPRDTRDLHDCRYRAEWAPYIGYPWTASLRQLNSWTVYARLRQILMKTKVDVINAMGEEAFLLPKLSRLTGSLLFTSIAHPYLGAIRPCISFTHPLCTLLAIIRMRDLLVIQYVCRQSAGIVTPSQYTRREAIHYLGVSPSRTKVVNHGIPATMLATKAGSIEREKENPILFFGRLEPQKGLDLLLMAYRDLLAAGVLCKQDLIVVGDGPEEPTYRKMAAELGISQRAQFVGWQTHEQIKEQMAAVSLCVLPSRTESFGLAMAETLAQQVPLVTTSAASIPEVVDSGKAAWLARPDDLASLRTTIQQAIENYPESLRKASYGNQFVRSQFTWERAARKYESLYDECLRAQFRPQGVGRS